jgi:hypothetical protein
MQVAHLDLRRLIVRACQLSTGCKRPNELDPIEYALDVSSIGEVSGRIVLLLSGT